MGESFDAWWLPDVTGEMTFRTIRVGELECRYPIPTSALMSGTLESLRAAGRALADRPVEEVVQAVGATAARLLDPDDPIRGDADRLLRAATGYSPEMVTLVLDRMAADWKVGPTRRLLGAELGDPGVLDRFTAAGPHRRVRAYGPRLALHVFAGNVPGVAVTSLVRALLVKSPSLGKLASGEPVLPVLFARALHSVDPDLARAVAVSYWPGGAEEGEHVALEAADLIVVYGGPEPVAAYRQRVRPHQRLVLHGPRFSVGLVGSEALDDPGLPDHVARAIATFDQQGCVSPHALWVEDPERARIDAFADALAGSLRRLETMLPRGGITSGEAATIQQQRGAAEMRGYARAGVKLPVRVLAPEGTAWTVVLDHEPALQPSCLNRFVFVHPVDSLDQAPELLAPAGHQLQSVAIAAAPERRASLAHSLARTGAIRVTSFERVPWPPPEWHHDGRGPLRELLRWVDLED